MRSLPGFLTISAFALCAAFGLAACGGGEEDKKSSSSSDTSPTTSTTGASQASAADEATVRLLTRKVVLALAEGDGVAACEELTEQAQAELQQALAGLNGTSCQDAVTKLGAAAEANGTAARQIAAARLLEVAVDLPTGLSGTVTYLAPLDGDETTLAVLRVGNEWLIDDLTATKGTAGTRTPTTPATTPAASAGLYGPSRSRSAGDAKEILESAVPPSTLPLCETQGGLPDGAAAGLVCRTASNTRIVYVLFQDSAGMQAQYESNGKPTSQNKYKCKQPEKGEGGFTSSKWGITAARLKCFAGGKTGDIYFESVLTSAGSEPIWTQVVNEEGDWDQAYNSFVRSAGPVVN